MSFESHLFIFCKGSGTIRAHCGSRVTLSLLPWLLLSPEFLTACTIKRKLKHLRQTWDAGWVQKVELSMGWGSKIVIFFGRDGYLFFSKSVIYFECNSQVSKLSPFADSCLTGLKEILYWGDQDYQLHVMKNGLQKLQHIINYKFLFYWLTSWDTERLEAKLSEILDLKDV